MSIPEEAIVTTRDDGTMVCWFNKLPIGTRYWWDLVLVGNEYPLSIVPDDAKAKDNVVCFVPEPTVCEAGWYKDRAVAAYDVIPNGTVFVDAVFNSTSLIKTGEHDGTFSGQLVYVILWPDGSKPERSIVVTESEVEVILDALEECRTNASFTVDVPAFIKSLNNRAFPGLTKLLNEPPVFDEAALAADRGDRT